MQFHPFFHLAGASPLPLDVGYLFLVGSNILLSMVVQQLVAILEFLQEKRSARPTPPSWIVMGKYLVSTYVPGTMPSIGSLSPGLMFFFVK